VSAGVVVIVVASAAGRARLRGGAKLLAPLALALALVASPWDSLAAKALAL
jgi:hypothetical protein